MKKITPFLWFDDNGQEAMEFYAAVFPDSEIISQSTTPDGKFFTGRFRIMDQEFMILNAGPHFTFNEAISMFVECEDQAEVDYYWEKLSAVPESEQCGWLKDKFGLSWQIIPKRLNELMADPDKEKAGKAMAAMMKMKKIDVSELEAAAEGA